ncbi:hypothetical protein BT96DRAFT_1026551 [Gymnopus androsaceus JB14]|uniref:FAD/NAD(P)-binding domain-containing protein n=1 Tax=Gymnopus androsaceus JB14 TaxID=1447944 RepID=A0A6A4GJQ5_9AGAR|nr:hypothetical protein BT96DRAFT_1026551 [Gymnopus androsaceus JB14]
MTALFILALLLTITGASQHPFQYTAEHDSKEASTPYQFKWPIHKVAIIGAGCGALVAYGEFARMGYQVRIFERDSPPEADFRPHLPPENVLLPYEEDFDNVDPREVAEMKRGQSAPSPIWDSLGSTGPRQDTQFRELPWPDHIPISKTLDFWDPIFNDLTLLPPALTHNHLQRYIRAFASFHGVNSNDNSPNASYNTRVERVDKRYSSLNGTKVEAGWTLLLRKFIQTGTSSYKVRWWTEDFDAVVVSSGRYNAPNYRRPEEFINQTVLIIGGSVSGSEIAEDISGKAGKAFLSVRKDEDSGVLQEARKRLLSRVPRNVSIIPEIKSFHSLHKSTSSGSGYDSGIQPGVVELINGTVLSGFDRIILATGFRYTLPYFPQYHDIDLRPNETIPAGDDRPQPLITDGTHVRSLHLDLFYIEEPTIGFINMNVGIDTFLFSEFAASAISKVWGGEAKLPSTEQMWDTHWQRLRDAGGAYSRQFMLYGPVKETAMIRYIVGWLNQMRCDMVVVRLRFLEKSEFLLL